MNEAFYEALKREKDYLDKIRKENQSEVVNSDYPSIKRYVVNAELKAYVPNYILVEPIKDENGNVLSPGVLVTKRVIEDMEERHFDNLEEFMEKGDYIKTNEKPGAEYFGLMTKEDLKEYRKNQEKEKKHAISIDDDYFNPFK